MQHYETPFRAFECGAAISPYIRVALGSNGKVTVAGIGDKDVGVLWEESFADGDKRTVYMNNGGGTQKVVAADSLDVGDEVFTAADGKVSDTQGTGAYVRGIALEAATADGDIIEIMPVLGETAGT